MNKGPRKATAPMRWEKRDGTVVEVAVGEEFFCLGAESGRCLVAVKVKHLFSSTVASIVERSEAIEA